MRLEEFLKARYPGSVGDAVLAVSAAAIDVWQKIPFMTGLVSGMNPSGEKQTEIDVYANDVFVRALTSSGIAAEVASEEMERPAMGDGQLHVSMDPLDGSSNIETNNPLGSIFGFYSERLPCSGERMLGAAFVTYGTMVTVTFSSGGAVHRFVAVNEGQGYSYRLMNESLVIPRESEVYGVGGLRKEWVPAVQRFVSYLEERGLKTRYCGTFVGDYNQVLKHGGIFAYPALKTRPKGKLRILFETAPIAYITERAGGYASYGSGSILSLRPSSLSETSPAYIGSSPIVKELEEMLRKGNA